MKISVKDNILVIEIPLQTPAPSKTGKTLVVASSHGIVKTDTLVSGKPVSVGVNAFISK